MNSRTANDLEQGAHRGTERTLSKALSLFVLVLGAFALMTGLSMMLSGEGFPAVAAGTVGLVLALAGAAQYRANLRD